MSPTEIAGAAAMTCSKYPNQFEGTVDGKPFYFRARNGHWTLQVATLGCDPVNGEYVASGEHQHAGAWEEHEARDMLARAITEYQTRKA